MKRLLTCLEDKRVLTVSLVGLVAVTILAVVSAWQIQTKPESGYEAAGTTEDGSSEMEVAVNQDPAALYPSASDEIPNAEEVGNQILVNEETQEVPVTETVQEPVDSVAVQVDPAAAVNLNYDGTEKLAWPVDSRNILMDYSMDSTVYYATLNQYKVSRGILIQSEPGNAVFAPANSLVTEVGTNEEIGNYVVLKLSDTYSATLGNLQGITVTPNQYILQGTVLGTLAQPTKYYVVEGPNLYFEVQCNAQPVDPLGCLE